jgi:hypothetical protein
MAGLEEERVETERRRKERQKKLDERKRQVEARRKDIQIKRGKRKADEFLDELGLELGDKVGAGSEMMNSIELAVGRENEQEDDAG